MASYNMSMNTDPLIGGDEWDAVRREIENALCTSQNEMETPSLDQEMAILQSPLTPELQLCAQGYDITVFNENEKRETENAFITTKSVGCDCMIDTTIKKTYKNKDCQTENLKSIDQAIQTNDKVITNKSTQTYESLFLIKIPKADLINERVISRPNHQYDALKVNSEERSSGPPVKLKNTNGNTIEENKLKDKTIAERVKSAKCKKTKQKKSAAERKRKKKRYRENCKKNPELRLNVLKRETRRLKKRTKVLMKNGFVEAKKSTIKEAEIIKCRPELRNEDIRDRIPERKEQTKYFERAQETVNNYIICKQLSTPTNLNKNKSEMSKLDKTKAKAEAIKLYFSK